MTKETAMKFKLIPFALLLVLAATTLLGGCSRYARNVNTLYEPSALISGGVGDVYVVIPEKQRTRSSSVKWVIGKVMDDENKQIDEVFSPRSPAEIIQAAFGLELRKAGYTYIPSFTRPAGDQRVLDLTKTEIELEQISDLADLKAKCRMLVSVDVLKNGQLLKRLQFEATSSKTDIKDRDMLAESVLQDALQSVMLKAMPELHNLLSK